MDELRQNDCGLGCPTVLLALGVALEAGSLVFLAAILQGRAGGIAHPWSGVAACAAMGTTLLGVSFCIFRDIFHKRQYLPRTKAWWKGLSQKKRRALQNKVLSTLTHLVGLSLFLFGKGNGIRGSGVFIALAGFIFFCFFSSSMLGGKEPE